VRGRRSPRQAARSRRRPVRRSASCGSRPRSGCRKHRSDRETGTGGIPRPTRGHRNGERCYCDKLDIVSLRITAPHLAHALARGRPTHRRWQKGKVSESACATSVGRWLIFRGARRSTKRDSALARPIRGTLRCPAASASTCRAGTGSVCMLRRY
jgi:hypothetical protein